MKYFTVIRSILVSAVSTASNKSMTFTPEKSINIVRSILNRADPEGIVSGTNSDEYDIEVAPIASFVYTFRFTIEKHSKSLDLYINRVWNTYFGYDCKLAEKIGSEIITELSKQKLTNKSNAQEDKELLQIFEKLDSAKLQLFGVK